jgi:hypothetical protein
VVASEVVIQLQRAVKSVRERDVTRGHDDAVWSAVFDPAGARVLTASDDTRRGFGVSSRPSERSSSTLGPSCRVC